MVALFSVEPLSLMAIIVGLCTLGLTSLRNCMAAYGVQTVALGLLAIELGVQHGEPVALWVGCVVLLLKGVGIPVYLGVVARRIGCRRDEGLLIAPPLLMFATLAAIALLVLTPGMAAVVPLHVWPSLLLVTIGMIFMMTRRMALTQIIGFLMLENGIFLYGISQPHSMPFIVELGVLVDVLAGTMLGGLLAFRLSDTFDHIDTTVLRELHG